MSSYWDLVGVWTKGLGPGLDNNTGHDQMLAVTISGWAGAGDLASGQSKGCKFQDEREAKGCKSSRVRQRPGLDKQSFTLQRGGAQSSARPTIDIPHF